MRQSLPPKLCSRAVSEEDDFSISEYVGRISDASECPGTKGTEITTFKINQSGKQFTMEGWGKVSAHKGAPEVVTHHIDGLTTTYSGSAWNWDGGADPKWINENDLYLWSIYPVGAISPTINYDGETPANIASFTGYTANGTDLLLAYNDEARQFEKDAKGNHSYDGNGILTDNIIGDPTVNIHFYHALAEVRFVLETTMDGADVHSITLCHVGADGNIVTAGEGIATTGDCVATGSGTGTGSVSFAWSNQGTKKPLHYEFTNTQSVAGGYASTGDGVNFMIPQTVQSNDIKIIVQFSKYGGSKYYTKVIDFPGVTWNAGYYYTYKLKIGEFHVPGELLPISTAPIVLNGLKNSGASGTTGKQAFDSDISAKGVTCVGFLIADYASSATASMPLYVYMEKNNVDPYAGKTAAQIAALPSSSIQTWSDIHFKNADARLTQISTTFASTGNVTNLKNAVAGIDYRQTYDVGLNYSGTETYSSLNLLGNTGASGKPKDSIIGHTSGYTRNGPYYFAYRIPENADNNTTNDVNTLNFIFKTSADSNNLGATVYVLGIVVIEVRTDGNLPGNFDDIDWSTLN